MTQEQIDDLEARIGKKLAPGVEFDVPRSDTGAMMRFRVVAGPYPSMWGWEMDLEPVERKDK